MHFCFMHEQTLPGLQIPQTIKHGVLGKIKHFCTCAILLLFGIVGKNICCQVGFVLSGKPVAKTQFATLTLTFVVRVEWADRFSSVFSFLPNR